MPSTTPPVPPSHKRAVGAALLTLAAQSARRDITRLQAARGVLPMMAPSVRETPEQVALRAAWAGRLGGAAVQIGPDATLLTKAGEVHTRRLVPDTDLVIRAQRLAMGADYARAVQLGWWWSVCAGAGVCETGSISVPDLDDAQRDWRIARQVDRVDGTWRIVAWSSAEPDVVRVIEPACTPLEQLRAIERMGLGVTKLAHHCVAGLSL